MSWEKLRSVLFAEDMYEAIIMLSMSPMTNVVNYYQLFVGCMLDFSDYHDNTKLKLVLDIIDKEDALDSAVKNTKIVRALLAIKAHYCKSDPSRCCWLFENANRMLAHIFQKYPDFLKLNFVKTNTKVKKFRFTEDDVKKWL